MNKLQAATVPRAVPTLCFRSLLLLPLILVSCSNSRLVDSDQVLDPGSHTIRSIIDSDVLISPDTSLHVDYAAGNRFFIQSGGTLTGLSKGVQNSTVYVEEGALIPARSPRSSLKVVNVDNAEQSFQDRFKTLLPANASSNRSPSGVHVVGGGAILGGGYYGHRYYGHRYRNRSYRDRSYSSPSRSVSVKPDSYRSRN